MIKQFVPSSETEVRYFFHIGYNGFNYRGWQKIPQAISVQAVIEMHLSNILKETVTIVGCGRTDAQVHASQFFFHADIQTTWEYDLLFRLNKNLPADIAVFDIIPVDSSAHARLHATSRTYNYFIHSRKDPYLGTLSSPYPVVHLNLSEMKKAVALLTTYTDYRAFCRKAAVYRTTICRVTSANLYQSDNGNQLRFEITANRFLHGMIRIIVQKLLLIGEGKLSVAAFEQQLITKESDTVTRSAHAQGLHLSHVKYPFLEMPSRSALFNAMMHDTRWQKI